MRKFIGVAVLVGVVSGLGLAPANASVATKQSAFCKAFTKLGSGPDGNSSAKQIKKWSKKLEKSASSTPSEIQDAIKTMTNSANSFSGNAKKWSSSPQALKYATAWLTVSIYALEECTGLSQLGDLGKQLDKLSK